MKKIRLLMPVIAFTFVLAFLTGCKKQDTGPQLAKVKVVIDYLGSGGYYNDNIDGIPSGLVVGTNGPFDVDPSKDYFLEYKAGSSWNAIRINSWSPTTTATWVIHCYVSGTTAHLQTYYE
jgi:hypothetical protein